MPYKYFLPLCSKCKETLVGYSIWYQDTNETYCRKCSKKKEMEEFLKIRKQKLIQLKW